MSRVSQQTLDAYTDVYEKPDSIVFDGGERAIGPEYAAWNGALNEAHVQTRFPFWNLPDHDRNEFYDLLTGIAPDETAGAENGFNYVVYNQVKGCSIEQNDGRDGAYFIKLPSHRELRPYDCYHFTVYDFVDRPRDVDEFADHVRGQAVFSWEAIDTLLGYASENNIPGVAVHEPGAQVTWPQLFAYRENIEAFRDRGIDDQRSYRLATQKLDPEHDQTGINDWG